MAAWIASHSVGQQQKAIQARQLYKDALAMLYRLNRQGYKSHAIVGIFQANAHGDDIFLSDGRRIPLLRQQHNHPSEPCLCLSDFIIPVSIGRKDRIGVFASTTDAAVENSYPDDPYQHLLAQTLADRLAEACIEKVHQHVRTTQWGYAPLEQFTPEELFAEKYQGIRPAVGYPSLPDQSLNFLLDNLIDFSAIGISLTENGAMQPHASTSGLMLAHPAARHFSIGTVGEDQLIDYAKRRGICVSSLKKFLKSYETL